MSGDFRTFVLDAAESNLSICAKKRYLWLRPQFSALKHVRSEKDPFTLMRLINANGIYHA